MEDSKGPERKKEWKLMTVLSWVTAPVSSIGQNAASMYIGKASSLAGRIISDTLSWKQNCEASAGFLTHNQRKVMSLNAELG